MYVIWLPVKMKATVINTRIGYRYFAAATRRRWLSTSNDTPPPSNMAAVVQGPSLVQTGLYRPSPSLMFLPGLRSLPFWTSFDGTHNRIAYQDPIVSHVVNYLQEHVSTFQEEYTQQQANVPSDYKAGGEHKLHSGSWDWRSYLLGGVVQPEFLKHFPQSSEILNELRKDQLLFEGTPFGFCFFSSLHPNSSIQAHTAPMNFRLRIHLPLVVPNKNCGIRVGPTQQEWVEGKAMVLDDSYQHEVWNESDETRVLLLVDIWHPDVKTQEKDEIVRMFQHAQDQGWLK